MTDPNAPTPGTENQIDYDAIEKLAKEKIERRNAIGVPFLVCIPPEIVLALVKKAKGNDAAQKILVEYGGNIGTCIAALRALRNGEA